MYLIPHMQGEWVVLRENKPNCLPFFWSIETGVYKTGNDFGWGISLVTHEGLVFLQNDNEESSFLAAFDVSTGEERWREEPWKNHDSYTTPLVMERGGEPQLVTVTFEELLAYDARTGKRLWSIPVRRCC